MLQQGRVSARQTGRIVRTWHRERLLGAPPILKDRLFLSKGKPTHASLDGDVQKSVSVQTLERLVHLWTILESVVTYYKGPVRTKTTTESEGATLIHTPVWRNECKLLSLCVWVHLSCHLERSRRVRNVGMMRITRRTQMGHPSATLWPKRELVTRRTRSVVAHHRACQHRCPRSAYTCRRNPIRTSKFEMWELVSASRQGYNQVVNNLSSQPNPHSKDAMVKYRIARCCEHNLS